MINNTQTKYQFLLQLFYGTENFFCTIERVQFLSIPQKWQLSKFLRHFCWHSMIQKRLSIPFGTKSDVKSDDSMKHFFKLLQLA